ncbi:hypothetical protein HYT59_01125 [Candidatus Woesebacteria bacterium]|nr:hypothetical protein [Candidatus Woesebacteria bacterium]
MRRYGFLTKGGLFTALNKLRSAFLAANDGHDVEEIINGLLTSDEKIKIGRRIQVAQLLLSGMPGSEIIDELKVGKGTVNLVEKNLTEYPRCFELILKRQELVDREYKEKAYVKVGGPKLIFKKKEYTGFRRKNVKR